MPLSHEEPAAACVREVLAFACKRVSQECECRYAGERDGSGEMSNGVVYAPFLPPPLLNRVATMLVMVG